MGLEHPNAYMAPLAYILTLCVSPEWQQRGLAKGLMVRMWGQEDRGTAQCNSTHHFLLEDKGRCTMQLHTSVFHWMTGPLPHATSHRSG